jgi:hypothetical protein
VYKTKSYSRKKNEKLKYIEINKYWIEHIYLTS